jgi:uroporphyrinogen III methyltransferase / synthase
LKRRTVVITRPREQSEELRRELEACGFQILFFPTIQIAPPASWEACDRALGHPTAYYDGLIFASVNGVKGFVGRMRELGLDPARYNVKTICAVGSKTAEELEAEGLTVSFVPKQHNADALAHELASADIHGRRFLFPRGNLGRDEVLRILGEAGADVEPVEVYRTTTPDMEGAESLLQRIFRGEIDVVAFASPSAVKNFAGAIPGGGLAELSARTTIAAIGPSTLAMARTLGGTGAIVARISTARGLADAIKEHFGDHE